MAEKAPRLKPHSPFLVGVVYPVLRPLVWLIFLVLGPFRVYNRRLIPKDGGVVIISNHLSDMDPVVVQYGCPRPIYFMAKSELFEIKVLGPLIRIFRAFPVRRGEPDRDAIKLAVELAQAGNVVCLFPEGQLSEDGELQELKPGASLIVRMAGVPVVCCGLQNTNRIIPFKKLIPRPSWHCTRVSWGEPRTFNKAESGDILPWMEAELLRLTGKTRLP